MLVYVYPQRLHNTILYLRMYIHHSCAILAQQQGQNEPWGDDWALYRGRLVEQATIASYLVRYAKDKALSSLQDKRVRQTIKDLGHSEFAHGRYISSEMS